MLLSSEYLTGGYYTHQRGSINISRPIAHISTNQTRWRGPRAVFLLLLNTLKSDIALGVLYIWVHISYGAPKAQSSLWIFHEFFYHKDWS